MSISKEKQANGKEAAQPLSAGLAWLDNLRETGQSSGLAALLIKEGEPAGRCAWADNSLCQTMQTAEVTRALCVRDCGTWDAQTTAPRRCHAGLYTVAAALGAESGEFLLGGRAFLRQSDYRALTERFRNGDLQPYFTPETLRHIIWGAPETLDKFGVKLNTLAKSYTAETASELLSAEPETAPAKVAPDIPPPKTVEAVASETPPDEKPPNDDAMTLFAAEVAREVARTRDLQDVAVLWLAGEKFAVMSGVGRWAASDEEMVFNPREAFFARAAGTKSSVRLRLENGRWDYVLGFARGQAAQPEAEVFPFLVNGEPQAALLIGREGLTNEGRREIAAYGSGLEWPAAPEKATPQPRPTARPDYAADFATKVSTKAQDEPYQLIIEQLAQYVGAQRASLLLYDEDQRELVMKASLGLQIALRQGLRISVDRGPAWQSIQSEQPVFAREGGAQPLLAERAYKGGAYLCYPLLAGEKRWGVVNFTEFADENSLPQSALGILQGLTPQILLALERAVWREKALRYEKMSITDPLTGLSNRRYLMARIAEEARRAIRHHSPFCFMMLDLDDFKHYNDQNGHQAGDEALVLLAQCLKQTLRGVDVAARYGGEEFSILLPQTNLKEARLIGERLLKSIAQTPFPHGANQPKGCVSVSIGVSEFGPESSTPEAIIKAADDALYHAKRQGKNNLQVSESE
jgi:diguanylate cyclase (GGDEF)-like protein